MVHAISTTRSNLARPHPDATRIAGLAAAITFNAVLLLLLLVPMSTPRLPLPDVTEPIQWIRPKVEPTPVPPVVPVTRPQPPTPTPRTLIQPQAPTQPVVDPVIVDRGTLQADPVEVAVATTADIGHTAPLPGVRLEYANAPAPTYPRRALRARLEGTVLLQVLVDIDGRPLQVQVNHSSGHRELDDGARQHVLKRWMFRPAIKDGQPVQAIGLVPIAFSLAE